MPHTSKASVVSLINYKGGVGKTTSAVNIAADLARYHDKSVLLVDADPQTNASACLMNPESRYDPECYKTKRTLLRAFEECGKRKKSYDVHDLIVENVVESDRKKVLPGLDLFASDPRLMKAEKWLTEVDSPLVVLKRELDKIKEEYDYIIIDCAPNLYSLTKNCLLASDYYIVPIIPDFLSSIGLELLVSWVHDFSMEMEEVKPKPVELAGVFFTRYKTITTLHNRMIGEIEARLAKGIPDAEIPPNQVEPFETKIRDLIAAAEAADYSLPLCIYRPNCDSAIDFRSLTEEFVQAV